MKHVFDLCKAGRPWHPPGPAPAGRAFWGMLEAQRTYQGLAAKARPLLGDCCHSCWSPDGTKVAFTLGSPGYNGVAIYDVAGQETDLLIAPGKDPSWSPDGRQIAFVRDAEALRLGELTAGKYRPHTSAYYRGEEVWVMNADGTKPRRLARGAGWPSWSRDSTRIYYHSRVENALFWISVEGQNAGPTRMMAAAAPFVSPDGILVAQTRPEGTSGGTLGTVLRITNMDSRSSIAEWAAPVLIGPAVWSPDGRELSFGDCLYVGVWGLWIYDVDKREAVKVLPGPAYSVRSPDRTKLLIRLHSLGYEAWVADLDPALSTSEALGPGQTLEEHCREYVGTCNRVLEVDPAHFPLHWARAASALWIDDPNASFYLKELEQALDRESLGPYVCFLHAQWLAGHPSLWERLERLALVMARKAVEQKGSYVKDLIPIFERLGRPEYADQLRQIAAANLRAGGCRYEKESGAYTVAGCGGGIWTTIDEFHFAYKRLDGSGSLTAKIENVENVDAWTEAGVMIRASLDPGERFAAAYATPSNGLSYQIRSIPDRLARGDIDEVARPKQLALRAPVWARIERKGDQFSAYYSTDGRTWTLTVWSPQTISMPDSVYIGLAVTSHDNKKTAEARFSHVTTTGNVSPAGLFTESQDIRFQLPSAPGAAASKTTVTGQTAEAP